MSATRTASDRLLLPLQWALAAVVFELGLLQAGLPLAELQARLGVGVGASGEALAVAGLVQALVGVLLVVPTLTGFVPQVSPLAAAVVALAFGAAAASEPAPVGLGMPLLDLGVALVAGAVALARGVALPLAALDLDPETRDPRHRPTAELERLR